MSKKILFLYSSEKQKTQLQMCEAVLRSILRKFRKSLLVSYIQTDNSPSCRDLMKDLLLRETPRHDAVLMSGDMASASSQEDFLKNMFGLCVTEHYTAGRMICYPENSVTTEQNDNSVIKTSVCTKENIYKAAQFSAEAARRRKHSITICTQADSVYDNFFLRHTENALGKERHLDTEHIYLDAMVSLCMRKIPTFDIVLTTAEHAKIIAMHLSAMPNAPTGYLLRHTESIRVYQRQILPCEEMNNTAGASIILAYAAILENEFAMRSAADWLRRAVSLAFEQYACAEKEDFIREVIRKIEIPMRKRRVN